MPANEENEYIPLIDIMVSAEARLECKLAMCLVIHPKEVIKKSNGFYPEVDQIVCKYWNAIMKKRYEIMSVSYNNAVEISLGLVYPRHEQTFWKWRDALADENSIKTIEKTIKNLRGLRAIRKSIDYIQINKILEDTLIKV